MSRVWAADPAPTGRPPELALVSDVLRAQATRLLQVFGVLFAAALVAAVVAGFLPSDDRHDLQRPTEVAATSVPAIP